MRVKHFIITRYFPIDDVYGEEMHKREFLLSWFDMFKNNLIRTLDNLSTHDFELVVLINRAVDFNTVDFLLLKKDYEITLIHWGDQAEYFKTFYNDYDYIVETRIDFDDFVFKDAIQDTYKQIDENTKIKMYGYCSGYTFWDKKKEFYDFYHEVKGIGHWSIFPSLIISTDFIKDKTNVDVYSFNHGRSKENLKSWCEKNGVKWDDKFFVQNLKRKAFIYYRPENSYSEMNDKKNGKAGYVLPAYTRKRIPRPNGLKEEFGFNL